MKKKIVSILLCVSLLALTAVGCESASGDNSAEETTKKEKKEVEIKNEGDPIILASMTDEESQTYGEIMKQVLEANGYEVESSGVGTYNNTTLPRQSLMEGQIDITMDYTGRGMMFIKDVDTKLYTTDLETAFKTTKEADAENGLVWMCYSPYNNTDGLCVKDDWAKENNIKTFDDFAKYVNDGGEMKVAVATENSYAATAPTCIPGWEETYGFKLGEKQLVVGVSEPQVMVSKGTDGIIASHCYTTGGTLEALGLIVIEDPKYVSPVYSPAAVCTQEFYEKYPEVEDILTPVFEAMDEKTIRHINKRLSADGEPAAELAAEWLQEKGFLE